MSVIVEDSFKLHSLSIGDYTGEEKLGDIQCLPSFDTVMEEKSAPFIGVFGDSYCPRSDDYAESG